MPRRAVFLDLDGTYLNEVAQVPTSAREAVESARANGHLVFVCTGRLPTELWPEILGDRFEVTGTTVVQFGPNSGELLAKGSGKVPAIQAVLAQFGVPVEDSIAYGDGLNDLEMLRYVHIGVATGNAHPHLKEAADRVTGTPDEHGIRTSFEALGLI